MLGLGIMMRLAGVCLKFSGKVKVDSIWILVSERWLRPKGERRMKMERLRVSVGEGVGIGSLDLV